MTQGWSFRDVVAPTGQYLPDDIRECCAVLREQAELAEANGWVDDWAMDASFEERMAATWQVLDYLGAL